MPLSDSPPQKSARSELTPGSQEAPRSGRHVEGENALPLPLVPLTSQRSVFSHLGRGLNVSLLRW